MKEASKTAPTLSSAVLSRNLLEHESPSKTIAPSLSRSVQHINYKVCKDMTAKQVGSETDDTFGNLLQFTKDHDFADLMRKHNDQEDQYHRPI